ncbi:MAG: DUF1385 domain-containing protein [Acidobacteria bacterium]|nr:DUF1385 domain-containing protein [Acidobacteriota bacterium]MCA1642316.1 DUF1385 domain-containing protein [Acidobacteriota bacterium]
MSANEKDLIVGGQAVVEGVMMRTPNAYAVAVRKPDGTIVHTGAALPKWSDSYKILKLPVLRGAAVLVQSMALGIKALNYSAGEVFADAEQEEKAVGVVLTPAVVEGEGDFAGVTGGVPGLFPVPTRKNPSDEMKRGANASAVGSIIFALVFNVLLFIVAPLVLTNALFIGAGWAVPKATAEEAVATARAQNANDAAVGAVAAANRAAAQKPWYKRAWGAVRGYLRPVRPSVGFNLIDGVIRMAFFLTMIFTFSLLKDIRRVFEYHGAEHKTVFTWEKGLPLEVEHARVQPRQHPRCGTSFLMVVMLVSIVLFSVVKFDSLAYNIWTRVALIPFIAGFSYEIIRASAKRESGLVFKLITRPGLWLQNITTQEPDDRQLEVAIFALKESLKLEPQPREAVMTPLS